MSVSRKYDLFLEQWDHILLAQYLEQIKAVPTLLGHCFYFEKNARYLQNESEIKTVTLNFRSLAFVRGTLTKVHLIKLNSVHQDLF